MRCVSLHVIQIHDYQQAKRFKGVVLFILDLTPVQSFSAKAEGNDIKVSKPSSQWVIM